MLIWHNSAGVWSLCFAETRAQKRTDKTQSACPSVLQHRRNTQLAKVRIKKIHTWQAGHQGALMHFCLRWFIILGKQCIEAPQCKIFDFLAGQHPRPFNNFKEIGCAPLVLILKTCSSLMMRDYYFCVWSKPINALKISIAANRYCYDFTISPKCNTRIIKINGMRKITQWWKLQIIALQRFERHTCRFGTVAIALQAPAIPWLSLTFREAIWKFAIRYWIIDGE